MRTIINPILKGFNPDPSIIRVGDDYYIATSTFEWFPGVQIHHSKDLVHWELIAHPLKRVSQLDMEGDPGSGGIWAPCLSYDNGVFYLIYTDVKNRAGIFMDTHNYLVTADDIRGEWSEPVYLNSNGFDPSLFHDEDGRKYLVNMISDHRPWKGRFGGIVLQEYSTEEKKLVGDVTNIFKGSAIGKTEGPHLYRRNDYYYLITAEGGTGVNHAVTVARSKNIMGPYEVDPMNPILTSKEDPNLVLQKAGHADIVETQKGEWYMVHLCARPIQGRNLSPLGRETAIQKVCWTEDGWLRLENGTNRPSIEVPAPDLEEYKFKEKPARDNFDEERLDINFQSLRVPLGEDAISLKERPGYLRLKGKESLTSRFIQSLVARRQQSFKYKATTCLEFEPDNYKQIAGLVCLHSNEDYYYLYLSRDEELGKCISILTANKGEYKFPIESGISIEGWDRCYLQVRVEVETLQFYYSKDEENWISIGPVFDAALLSNEYCRDSNFTGAFVGLCCQDLNGTSKAADFDYFEYVEM